MATKDTWLRRLDHLPPWTAGTLGVLVGVVAAVALLAGTPTAVGVTAFVGLLGVAAALTWTGEPVGVLLEDGGHGEEEPEPPELSSIPAGRFLMGSPEAEEGRYDGEGPVHEVRISTFDCMQYLVTRRLYQEIMGKDPSWPEGDADERPVNQVRWYDAVRFCNQLSKRDGLVPCYEIDDKDVRCDWNVDGYRLPTEAEWEYACRAGSTTRWSFGDEEERLGESAWFRGNSDGKPQPVGQKRPNVWDLYDMHGNVLEWCWDKLGSYTGKPQEDPRGPDDRDPSALVVVLRGGSFANSPRDLRSAFRDGGRPEYRDGIIGFRCVRIPRRQP